MAGPWEWIGAESLLVSGLALLAGFGLALLVVGIPVSIAFRGQKRAARLAIEESQTLAMELAVAQARLAEISEAKRQVDNESLASRVEVTALRVRVAELETRLLSETTHSEQRLQSFREAEQRLTAQFENLANRILEEKTQKFTEHNRVAMDTVLAPLKEQLGEFRKRVDEIQVSEVRDRTSLRTEMQLLREQTQRINQEALNLTRALKGDRKTQGTWGEMVLEQVLERSGLRKGIEYHVQGGFRDIEQRLLKPDVVVHLPEGKDIVIDSKVSLLAYERYCSADTDADRDLALREHAQSIRRHIVELGKKDYAALPHLRSLDFVLLFMPIEAAFLIAFQFDEKLFGEAFEHKIVVVTPTTLLATLRTIDNIWRYERQNENAALIADKAGQIYDKLRGALEDLEKLGGQIETLRRTYDGVVGKLSTGRGNLVRQVEGFRELGVKVGKSLPKTFIGESDESPDP